MSKKSSRVKIIKQLDKLTSQIVIMREGKKCVMCNSDLNVGNGHIFSRRNFSLRWDIRSDGNCHPQCWKHNFLHSSRDSYPYFNWYIRKFGQKRFDELHTEWVGVTIVKQFQLELLRENLQKVLIEMEGGDI